MSEKPKVSDLITSITDDVKTIVRGEIELAKAELIPQAKSFGLGAGLLGAAGYFAIVAAGMLFTGFALGTALLFIRSGWEQVPALFLGFLIWAIVFFLLAGILALVGRSQVQKLKGPQKAIEAGVDTVSSLSSSIEAGKATATRKNVDTPPAPAETPAQ